MTELGKIERVEDLRRIWSNEARDFTVWLAQDENLAMLGETVGIDIDLEERESFINCNYDKEPPCNSNIYQ